MDDGAPRKEPRAMQILRMAVGNDTLHRTHVIWASQLPTLYKIAARYGLNETEAKRFLTIPSTSNELVFYPFHFFSRSQARKIV